MKPTRSAPREAWDLARFEKLYNALADERGGWYFEKTPGNIRRVEQDWATSSERTLAEFAEGRFRYDQRT